jgi:hypothetical protein
MKANNIHNPIRIAKYQSIKINKHDIIYQCLDEVLDKSFLTNVVKIEKFQGFSKVFNVDLYFRIKDQSSWAKSKQITGLFKTNTKNVFYGDFKHLGVKTLLVFRLSKERDVLMVYEFPKGCCPHKSVIDKTITQLFG